MHLREGDDVLIRTEDGYMSLHGRVEGFEGPGYVIRPEEKVPGLEGRNLLIVHASGSISVRVEEIRPEGVLFLLPSGEERRAFFRVDDVIPVRVKRADSNSPSGSARFISPPLSIEGLEPISEDVKEGPMLNLLKEINTKLDFLINNLMMKNEGLSYDERLPVNLSATGMRFDFDEEVRVGDIMEVKMVLPTYPPVAILTYGEVVRVREVEKGGRTVYETALKFTEMTEEVREEIIQYTLKRQREVIKRRWEET